MTCSVIYCQAVPKNLCAKFCPCSTHRHRVAVSLNEKIFSTWRHSSRFSSNDFPDNDYFKWNNYGIGRNLLFMSCTGIAFFVILLVTEYSVVSSSIYSIRSFFTSTKSPNESDEPIDFDVVEEKNRVKQMSETEIRNHNLVLMEMTKLYGKFMAVHEMSIAVEQFVLKIFFYLFVNNVNRMFFFRVHLVPNVLGCWE